jgi:hypothetical protein
MTRKENCENTVKTEMAGDKDEDKIEQGKTRIKQEKTRK